MHYKGMHKGLRGLRGAACRFADERAQGGVAPMHLAAAQGHLEAVRALLEKGASLAVQCKMVLVRAEQVGQDVWLDCLEIMVPLLAPGKFMSYSSAHPPGPQGGVPRPPTPRPRTWALPGGTRPWCS